MILLDQTDRRPIYEQIAEKLSDLMMRGVLEENTPLPSVRNLAAELSINPNTVQRAYTELDRLGYTYSVKGKGSFVAAMDSLRARKRELLLEEIKAGLCRAKEAGIDKKVLIDAVSDAYGTNSQKGGSGND